MTDNEIIKALECCNGWDGRCLNCPLNREGTNCKEKLNSYALDLINRQKEEIKELKDILEKVPTNAYDLQVEASEKLENQIKSEVIKEFAERLKTNFNKNIRLYGRCTVCDATTEIDDLVKEMTEVSE